MILISSVLKTFQMVRVLQIRLITMGEKDSQAQIILNFYQNPTRLYISGSKNIILVRIVVCCNIIGVVVNLHAITDVALLSIYGIESA